MPLYYAALLDVLVLFTCAMLMWKYARISALHPGFMYLVFHSLVFTARMFSILGGSPTLFTGFRGGLPVSEAEIAWAANLADIALVTMTAAWIKGAADDRRRHGVPTTDAPPDPNGAVLSENVIWFVAAVSAPIGLVALLYFGNTPTAGVYKVDLGDWNTSSWTVITQSWTGLALLALIYYYGFRKVLVVPMSAYLLVMAVQGYNRFRVIVPLLFLLCIWLSRKGRKWPPTWMTLAGLGVLLVFFPMKTIGRMLQSGEPISDITEVSANILSDVTTGRNQDQMIMDEFASIVTLVDDAHHYYYGTLYYPLLVVLIPKQWWPDKPPINGYVYEISTPSRPMARTGMVTTLHGESYANLGVLGIIIISYLSAFCLGRFYFRALRRSYLSVYRFMYVMIAANLVQVFRDGLTSLIVFTVINMGPMVLIALLSYFSFRRDRRWSHAYRSFAPGRERGVAKA
jgi:hypothetical protein